MTEPEDDLAAAFADLHAPGSTASYRTRTPSVEAAGRVGPARWPQLLAAGLAVVVAVVGAGTFLALRSARQQGGAAPAGYPAARINAAMAFDSTTGRTVMFGGGAAAGGTLSDTWLWDGSAWSMLPTASPGALMSPRLSDDPADGGVLLTGLRLPASSGVVTGGCAVAGTGAAVGTSVPVASMPASSGAAVPPALPAPAGTAPPARPPAPLPPPPPPPPVPSSCPAPPPPPPLETWLLTARGWAKVASTTNPGMDTPAPGSVLAYDATTHTVVAVSPRFNVCAYPGPLRGGDQPQIACPLTGTAAPGGPAGSSALAPCPAGGANATACPAFVPTLTTWTWSLGHWSRKAGAVIPGALGGTVFSDTASAHATLLVETSQAAPSCATCSSAAPNASLYTWAGSAWSQSTVTAAPTPALSIPGAVVAAAGGHVVALGLDAKLYIWSETSAGWVHDTSATQPGGRTGAAMAEGPGGTIVLFGGSGSRLGADWSGYVPSRHPPVNGLGSDTWTWDGATWRHLAGAVPSPPAPPTFCSDNSSPKNPCIKPAPIPAVPPSGTGAPGIEPGGLPAAPATPAPR